MTRRAKIAFYIPFALGLIWLGAEIVGGQSIEKTLSDERAKLGARPSLAEVGSLLNTVGAKYDFIRLLRKDGGTRCPSPVGEVACDIFIDLRTGRHYDVLEDADGEARPLSPFADLGPCELGPTSGCELSRAVRPVLAEGPSEPVPPSPVPGPQPPPQPTPADPTILDALGRIEAAVKAVGTCPGLTDAEVQDLIRAVKAPRPVELKGGWMVGTIRGTIGGVQ